MSSIITDNKLPSYGQMLSVFLYDHQHLNKTIRESTHCCEGGVGLLGKGQDFHQEKEQHLVAKMVKLFEEWRAHLKKNKKESKFHRSKELASKEKLNDLFDIAHQNSLCI